MTVEHSVDGVAITVFAFFFLLVTVMGFLAARWRRASLDSLDQWGLGGRRFGTVVTWFLLGGDLYTAYTFIAVPALVFGAGAVGFFALPYTIILYPFAFLVMARLWSVCARHSYVTPADFVKGRFGGRGMPTAIAFTGLLATMPYIALQLVGLQVVVAAMGLEGDLPIIIAFAILAAYTYQSGLRAPALIALVKDSMIYITVLAIVIYVPSQIGGFDNIFDSASKALPDAGGELIPTGADAQIGYATLALGSALALFLYPHSVTAVLGSKSQDVVRRNMVILPAYTFLLGLLALTGYFAIAAGLELSEPNFAVPDLVIEFFPSWFTGFAFAAVAIGALVPAAIMSIAAANLFTRNIYKEFFRPQATDRDESKMAKIVSLVVKLGALGFVLFLPNEFSIDLQLLGGVWILQTLPALIIGLYTGWLHRGALLAGWAVGMVLGTLMAASQSFAPIYPLDLGFLNVTAYTGVFALLANLLVSAALTPILNRRGRAQDADDRTSPDDYDELEETGTPAPLEGAATTPTSAT